MIRSSNADRDLEIDRRFRFPSCEREIDQRRELLALAVVSDAAGTT